MHVGGSHMYPDVIADLLLTKELATGPDALVAIDDIRSAHTPGVWAATWECVYRHGLEPFAVSSQKMYATWGTPTREFADAFTERIRRCAGLEVLDAPISGGTVHRVVERPATPSRLGPIALDWFPPTLSAASCRRRRRAGAVGKQAEGARLTAPAATGSDTQNTLMLGSTDLTPWAWRDPRSTGRPRSEDPRSAASPGRSRWSR